MSDPLRGLFTPFQRDQRRDFASGTGAALLDSKVVQVLATEGQTARSSGELPWRTTFGGAFPLLRHQRNDEALAGLAHVDARGLHHFGAYASLRRSSSRPGRVGRQPVSFCVRSDVAATSWPATRRRNIGKWPRAAVRGGPRPRRSATALATSRNGMPPSATPWSTAPAEMLPLASPSRG